MTAMKASTGRCYGLRPEEARSQLFRTVMDGGLGLHVVSTRLDFLKISHVEIARTDRFSGTRLSLPFYISGHGNILTGYALQWCGHFIAVCVFEEEVDAYGCAFA